MGFFDKLAGRAKDPFCGMTIDRKEAADIAVHAGQKYYFCSKACALKFRADPAQFA